MRYARILLAFTIPLLPAASSSALPLRALLARLYETAAVSAGQTVTFDPAFLARLAGLAADESVEVEDWPLAPGVAAPALLTRHEVYAPDARLYRVDAAGPVEVARSSLAFYTGRTAAGEASIWLSLEPGAAAVEGGANVAGRLYELRPAGRGRSTLAAADSPPEGAAGRSFECAASPGRTLAGSAFLPPGGRSGSGPPGTDKLGTLHTATLAVDTDNELLMKKFANDTAAAGDYIGQLLTAMSAVYSATSKSASSRGRPSCASRPPPTPTRSARRSPAACRAPSSPSSPSTGRRTTAPCRGRSS